MPVKPDNHLGLAIFTMLCCCMPLGIVALIKAQEVNNNYLRGDYEGAQNASTSAFNWGIAALILGFVSAAAYALINVIGLL